MCADLCDRASGRVRRLIVQTLRDEIAACGGPAKGARTPIEIVPQKPVARPAHYLRAMRLRVPLLAFAVLAATSAACGGDEAVAEEIAVRAAAACARSPRAWRSEGEWPTRALGLGVWGYDDTQLRALLHTPVRANGLTALAHELVAAKLNLTSHPESSDHGELIAEADERISWLIVPPVGTDALRPEIVTELVQQLRALNLGDAGLESCAGVRVLPMICGDGFLDPGEACDDANGVDADGCTTRCTLDRPSF